MSNTNANFEMTGILLGQEARKRKTPQEKMHILADREHSFWRNVNAVSGFA